MKAELNGGYRRTTRMSGFGAYALRRLAGAIPLLLGLSLISFVLIHLAPGDPVALIYGTQASPEDIAHARANWGLDQPLPVQFFFWLTNFVRGDFGRSYSSGQPVVEVIASRVGYTLVLGLTALIMALFLGILLGSIAAFYSGRWPERILSTLATVCYALPAFWLGLLLILLFGVYLRWLPTGGTTNLRSADAGSSGDFLNHLILPALVLSLREFGRFFRYTRSGLQDVLGSDYLRTARSKGLSETSVAIWHALPNGLAPVVTVVGLSIPQVVGGSIIVETIFAWPGVGRLTYEAALGRDYPVIMGLTLLVGTIVILGNLLADLTYALLDPRIRLTGRLQT